MSRVFYIRYVLHARRSAYEALGWIYCGDVPGHHGLYSCRMQWNGAAHPPEPPPENAVDLMETVLTVAGFTPDRQAIQALRDACNEQVVPHHNADGSIKHYCSASYCPDIHGPKS